MTKNTLDKAKRNLGSGPFTIKLGSKKNNRSQAMQKMLSFVLITVFVLFMCLSVNAQEEQGRAYYDLGIFAFEDEEYDAALENFKKALSFSPNNPYFNHYLGKTYMKMELYDEAENHLDRAWEIDPSVEGLKYDYAFLNYKMSNYEKSADLFVEIVEEDPSNVLAQYHGGISLYKMKRYSDALNYFLNASEKSPTIKTNGYYYAGICYRKMGKDKEAVEIFKYVRDNAELPSLKEYVISVRTSLTQKCQDIADLKGHFVSGHR
jgi:tetratricopeptide (TPR) repeat protein